MKYHHPPLLPTLIETVEQLRNSFDDIPDARKQVLQTLVDFISEKAKRGKNVKLNFICTHNSRRSHIAQLWAQAAAHYYGITDVEAFSGGTEATAFHPRAVKAMNDAGFELRKITDAENPVYAVRYSNETAPQKAFSKKYDDTANPATDFAAIMTCSHADENCPLIPGATLRIPITYDDPKDFDNTSEAEAKYRERVLEIGREMLYVFSQVKQEDELHEQ